MKMKKFLFFLFIFFLIFQISFCNNSYAKNEVKNSSNIVKPPIINARHAIVLDRNSEVVLYGKKEKDQCKMASTTKIMTAIVVIENTNLKDIVTVSSKAAHTGGSRLGLISNCKITVEDLLYGLMLKSGNDTAVALAEYVGKNLEGFAELMNKKAKELNLQSTNFVTPHGLDNNNHYTTAYDLAILTNYALKNKTFSKIVKTKSYTIHINNKSKNIQNTNELLGNLEGVYGVKTGFTNGANRCLVTSCKRGNLDIVCVVLGCDTKKNRTKDSMRLINYIFNNFSVINVEEIIDLNFLKWLEDHNKSFYINKGVSNNIKLELNKNEIPFSTLAVNKEDLDNIDISISFDSFHDAPLHSYSKVGSLALNIGDVTYFEIDILNINEIKKKQIYHYFIDLIFNYSYYFDNSYKL